MTSSDRVTEAARRVEWSRGLRVWHRHKFDVITDAMALADAEIAAAVLAASPAVTSEREGPHNSPNEGQPWFRCYSDEPHGPHSWPLDAACPGFPLASPAVTAAEDETRGKCSQCLITYAIRSDGNVRHHRHISGSVCTGSGRPPAVTAVPAEQRCVCGPERWFGHFGDRCGECAGTVYRPATTRAVPADPNEED